MKNLTFITGAARSGKSILAEELAVLSKKPVFYFATMQVQNDDPEQVRRLNLHRARRPSEWQTVDAPFDAQLSFASIPPGSLVIFDCLSLYVTNLLIKNTADDVKVDDSTNGVTHQSQPDPYGREEEILKHIDELLKAMEQMSELEFIVVTNEVGWGIVPEYKLARAFRDVLGLSNQKVAAAAEKAFLCCSGLRVSLK